MFYLNKISVFFILFLSMNAFALDLKVQLHIDQSGRARIVTSSTSGAANQLNSALVNATQLNEQVSQHIQLGTWAKSALVIVGRIDDAHAQANELPNAIQVHVQGDFKQRVAYPTEDAQFYSETDLATKDVLEFINKNVVPTLLQNPNPSMHNFAFQIEGALSKSWVLMDVSSRTDREQNIVTKQTYEQSKPLQFFGGQGIKLYNTHGSVPTNWSIYSFPATHHPGVDSGRNVGPWQIRGFRADLRLRIPL